MGKAKDIQVKFISSADANRIIKNLHYSGKVVPNSQVHFGVFLDGKCGGALSFGPSLCKKKIITLVEDTGWNEFIELNRMALADWLPRNGESRAISVCLKLIKKHYPHIKWVISFADGCQCGDGTIYRASGFILTHIKKNVGMWRNKKTGEVWQDMQFFHTMTKRDPDEWERLGGYMFRYMYFLDKSYQAKMKCKEIPYSEIDKLGIGMYKGKRLK